MECESSSQIMRSALPAARWRLFVKFVLAASILISVLSLRAATSVINDTLDLSPANASYTMHVRLDPESRLITGSAVLTWRNMTGFPAPDLRFHMYFNAWLNTHSSFLNSVRHSDYDFSDFKENDWAFVRIDTMQILPSSKQNPDTVTNDLRYIQPDDGNPADRTVLQLPLKTPVAPGDAIQIAFTFRTKVPKTFRRVGARGNYFFLAHWFPKIGVFEENGVWNCRQYIQTEYFSDFGTYDVSLTVPSGWVVGATGREIETDDYGEDESTHRFFQKDVHEFAWVASPHFSVHKKRFEHPGLPSVDMRLLLMPDHAAKKERYFAAAEAALQYYGLWAGAYPYGHVTVIDPAYGSRTGGMEYPTFFTGGTRWLSPIEARSPEGVTVHEAGHQFWYGIIANNEFEHAWLDEGFNTYFTTRTMQTAYPDPVYTKRYFHRFIPVVFPSVHMPERTDGADAFDGLRSAWKRDPMSADSWRHGPGSYGLNSYTKPALMLRTLENYFGWKRFHQVLKTYFARWKFKHPKPEDFFAVVTEVTGEDMSWYFDQVWDNTLVFDYAVGEVESKALSPARGYAEKSGDLVFEEGHVEEADSTVEKKYRSTVNIRRWGEGVFPIDLRITFSNGETLYEQWDGAARWTRFSYTKSGRVETVEIDPNHYLTLDVNYTNNSWTRKPRSEQAAAKWSAKWMLWLQHVLEFFAFFG